MIDAIQIKNKDGDWETIAIVRGWNLRNIICNVLDRKKTISKFRVMKMSWFDFEAQIAAPKVRGYTRDGKIETIEEEWT